MRLLSTTAWSHATVLLIMWIAPTTAFSQETRGGEGESGSSSERARGRVETVLGRSGSEVGAETSESATRASQEVEERGDARPDKIRIMRSGEFYFGQSVSMSREEALQNSKADLINKIVTRVVSQASQGFTEDDEAYRSYYNQTTRTASRLELRGLDYLVEQRRDDSFEVTSFINKADFERSLQKETDRQLGLFRSARLIEEEQGLNQAIPWYYGAYLNTFFFPDLLLLELEDGERADAQTWYRNRLQEWVSELDFEVGRASGGTVQDLFQAEVPLSVEWNGEPARSLAVGLDLPDYGKTRTVEGRTRLFIDRLPERRRQTYRITFQPVLEETPANRELNDLAIKTGPFFQRDMEVDFGELVRVDVGVRRLSDTAIRFSPELRNLSVAQFEWQFGNGETSMEQSPTLQLDQVEEPLSVILTVNGHPDLQVRRLYADGKLTDPDAVPVRPVAPPETSAGDERSIPTPPEPPTDPTASAEPVTPEEPAPSAQTGESVESDLADSSFEPPASTSSRGVDVDLLQDVPLTSREREFVWELKDIETVAGLQDALREMMKVEQIRSGGSQSVPSPGRSFIAIVDPVDRSVKAFLTPEVNGVRTDLRTGRTVRDLAAAYKGLGPVFIQFL